MNIFRTPLIATAVLAMTSWAAYAQVRIITPDSEHIYSSDPREAGRLLDDEALQRENERRESARMESRIAPERIRRAYRLRSGDDFAEGAQLSRDTPLTTLSGG